jgi:membrane-bound lytic murein transglycosylase A
LPIARTEGFLAAGVLSGVLLGAAALWWWGHPPGPRPLPEPPPITAGEALRPVQVPAGLADDADAEGLLLALAESRRVLEAAPARELGFGPDRVPASAVAAQLAELERLVRSGLSGAELLEELLGRWRLYESAAGEGGVLFTGYYEGSLRGSRREHGPYRVPLYRPPPGLVTADLGLFAQELAGRRISGLLDGKRLVPVPARAEIARGALAGRGLELLWVDDPVEAFFVEIQGSARVSLDDGTQISVGYAEKNGHPYRPIGALLRDEDKIPREKMSAQAIKAYLRESPHEQRRVFDHNPSVVFFRERRGPEGSTGAIVTAGRSIATDSKLFPPGALALIRTSVPVLDEHGGRIGEELLVRLVLNQDTGGAIRGPGRVDLFTGYGPEAEALAGQLQHRGSLYFLAPLAPVGRSPAVPQRLR